MSRRAKIWLVIAASLVVLGLTIFAAVMTVNHWDFTKLSTAKYETNAYEVSEGFSNISMETDTADILFVPSDDGICKVICYEQKNMKHSVDVQDGTLMINAVDDREWYEYIGITLGTPKVTVYLPETEYVLLMIKESTGDVEIPKDFKFESIDISVSTGDVKSFVSASEVIKIKTSTGDIRVENASAGTLDLSVSTGNVNVSGVACEGDVKINVSTGKTNITDTACKSVTSTGSTGDLSLKNVIAAEKFSLERSTGDVKFDGADAAEIFVKTDTGDVTGSLLTDKVFITQTDTGSIDVPQTVAGGRCEITTDTGDIRIHIS